MERTVIGPVFAIETSIRGKRPLLVVSGEIDLKTAPELENAVVGAGATAGEVLVDLERVDFIDSSGLRSLTRAQAHLKDRGTDLYLIVPDGPVRRTMRLTGLSDEFQTLESAAALPDTT